MQALGPPLDLPRHPAVLPTVQTVGRVSEPSTYAALEDAIRAHVAASSDEGEIVTDWYLIVAGEVMTEQRTNYTHIANDAPLHTHYGLVSLALRRLLQDD